MEAYKGAASAFFPLVNLILSFKILRDSFRRLRILEDLRFFGRLFKIISRSLRIECHHLKPFQILCDTFAIL